MDYSGDIIKILKLETNVHVTRANVEYGGQSSILAAVSRWGFSHPYYGKA